MKNLKKIIFATLLVAIMLTTVAFSSLAKGNLTPEDFEKIVADIEKLDSAYDKEVAIRYAMLDLKAAGVDLTAPEFDALMKRFYNQNTLCAQLYLDEFDGYVPTNIVMDDVNARYASLNAAVRLLTNEYAPLADDYDETISEYYARHISMLNDFVNAVDHFNNYSEKDDVIDTTLKYLEIHSPNFTSDNYTSVQLSQINALLVKFGDECVEFVTLGQAKFEEINTKVNNNSNPLNQANSKRDVLTLVAEIMTNEYAVLSENYSAGSQALSELSFALVKDLVDLVHLTEKPVAVKNDVEFRYFKNKVLIYMDQIVELGYCNTAEGFDEYLASRREMNFSVLELFVDLLPTQYTDYDTAQLLAANSAMKQVKNLILRYFTEDTGANLTALMAIFDERCELYQAAYDKYIIFRDNHAPLSDYAKADTLMAFDGLVGNKPTNNGVNSASGIKDYVDWNGEVNRGLYFQPEGNDFYTYFNSSSLKNTVGVIVEFDITTFDDEYLANVWFNHGSTTNTSTGESLFPPNFMGVLSGGNLHADYSTGSALLLEHAVIPGQWTRIALAYNASKCTYNIYVDGILVQENRDAKINGTITWYFTTLRVNAISTDGEKSAVMDNFAFYKGTALRTYERYQNMSDEEKFEIYSDIYSDDSMEPPVRLQAYELGANALIAKYYNADSGEYLTDNQTIIDIIENRYLLFKYDEVLKQYQEELIFGLKERVDALNLISRGFDTISKRKTNVTSVDAYITAAGDYMPKGNIYTEKDAEGNVIGSFSFTTLTSVVDAVRTGITEDILYQDFCARMYRYQRASTSVAKQRYYSEAMAYAEDPLFNTAVVNNVEYNPAAGVSKSLTLSVAWNLYVGAASEINGMVRTDNSDVIVKCVNVIREYDTVAEWAANYDYLNEYVLIMREIIDSGEYDENYPGFTDAKLFYDQVNAYFYGILQDTHVAILTAELDRFPTLTTYIEKIGFCLFIDNYLANNDIDYTNSKIKSVIDRYEIYIADIGAAEEDYQDVLNQNTKYFVNIVNELQTCVKYEDIKAKLQEASLYLHAMNTGAPEAEIATAIYDEYDELIKRYDASYKQFAVHTALIATCVTEDDMFETLVNCNIYRADVLAILEGVESYESSEAYDNARAALALYDAAYAVYNARISGANINISATLKLIGSMRDPAEIDNVIAIMLTEMKK